MKMSRKFVQPVLGSANAAKCITEQDRRGCISVINLGAYAVS